MLKPMHRAICLALAALLAVAPAYAHHSAAMFDDQKSVTLSGTVRIFQWTNPHCWIQLLVPGQAQPIEWSVEMGSPSVLYNKGWKPKTLKEGDKIIVSIHPTRDGSNGGVFISGTDGAGKPLVVAP